MLIGDNEDLSRIAESMEFSEDDPTSILDRASKLNPKDVLRRIADQDPEQYGSLDDEGSDGKSEPMGITSHLNILTGQPKPTVYIAQIPTAHAFEIPAYLKYGGWNACPGPEEQVALHKMWAAQFGSEIVAATGDVIECQVSRPPSTREAAGALAREQYIYCSDIVDQGVGSLAALAATLENSGNWFFWWD